MLTLFGECLNRKKCLRLANLASDWLIVWSRLMTNSPVPKHYGPDGAMRVHWLNAAHGLQGRFVLVRPELLIPLT